MDPTLSLPPRLAPRAAGLPAGAAEPVQPMGSTMTVSPRTAAARASMEAALSDETRFVERGELGRGGMGRVMLAHDRHLERVVAIKQSLSEDAAHQLRFAREVRITARLEHPSIVPIHDAGCDTAGQPYYVMRRLEGQPLDELVCKTASPDERLAMVPHVLAAADAAGYAHAQGIIHRDIKPSNILVGRYGETWLIDWGLARELAPAIEEPSTDTRTPLLPLAESDGLTRAGDVVGTPGFVAPEQARGEAVDERADVYSLGATLLYALTGQLVYPERTPARLLERAAAAAPIQLDRHTRALPGALLAIVAAATASRREARYRSGAALAADLRRFLTGQLVAAHQYSRGERLRRFVRQHRNALVISTAATLALVAGGAFSLHRIIDERDRASAAERRAVAQRTLAEKRNDQLLLERARTFARPQPTAALATLKRLPAASEAWPAAWGVAAQAAASGVSFGLGGHQGNAYALAFSPDGARLVSGGDDGLVQAHELARRASLPLAREPARINHVLWLDDEHVLYGVGGELVSVAIARDLSSRQLRRRELAALHAETLAPDDDRRRLATVVRKLHLVRAGGRALLRYSVDETLYQIDAALTEAPRRLSEAESLVGSAIGTAVIAGGELRWIDAEGESVLLDPHADPTLIAAIDETARRLALSTMTEVRELALPGASAAPLHRWPLVQIRHLTYSPSGLCMSTGVRSRIARPALPYPGRADRATSAAAPPPGAWMLSDELIHGQLHHIDKSDRGCSFFEYSGRATVIYDDRQLSIAATGTPITAVATSPRSGAFAALHRGGSLEVWPAQMAPKIVPVTLSSVSTISASSRALYLYDMDQLSELDRATGAITPLLRGVWGAGTTVVELDDRHLLIYYASLSTLSVFDRDAKRFLYSHKDLSTIATRSIDLARAQGADAPALQLIARGGEISSFEPATGRLTPLVTVGEPLLGLAMFGNYAIACGAQTTWRIDLRAAGTDASSTALPSTPHDGRLPAAIDGSGTLWLASERGLVRWDGVTRREHELPARVIEILPHHWLGVLVRDANGAVHTFSPDGQLRRSVATSTAAVLSPLVPYAVWLAPGSGALVLGDLVGGEHISLPLGRAPGTTFSVDEDGAIVVLSLIEQRLLIFPPLLPHRAEELAAWLGAVTNAEIEIDSSEPRWNLGPSPIIKLPGP